MTGRLSMVLCLIAALAIAGRVPRGICRHSSAGRGAISIKAAGAPTPGGHGGFRARRCGRAGALDRHRAVGRLAGGRFQVEASSAAGKTRSPDSLIAYRPWPMAGTRNLGPSAYFADFRFHNSGDDRRDCRVGLAGLAMANRDRFITEPMRANGDRIPGPTALLWIGNSMFFRMAASGARSAVSRSGAAGGPTPGTGRWDLTPPTRPG